MTQTNLLSMGRAPNSSGPRCFRHPIIFFICSRSTCFPSRAAIPAMPHTLHDFLSGFLLYPMGTVHQAPENSRGTFSPTLNIPFPSPLFPPGSSGNYLTGDLSLLIQPSFNDRGHISFQVKLNTVGPFSNLKSLVGTSPCGDEPFTLGGN